MSSNKKMSVEQILAACRGQGDSAAAGEGTEKSVAAESAGTADVVQATASDTGQRATASTGAPSAPAKPAGQMSVAEILAAARSKDAGAASPTSTAPPAGGGGTTRPAAPSGASKDPSKMSVTDILAAARGQGDKAAPAKPAPAKPAVPAVKPAAVKAKAPAAAGSRLPRETSSILAAARKSAKPGPMSKEEAAQRLKAGAPVPKAPVVAPPRPEKPSYARPKPAPAPTGEPRRGFLTVFFGSFLAVGFSSLAAVGGLWSLGLARFMFPNILTEPPSRFKVGFPGDFPPESVATQFKAQYGIWITNTVFEGQRQIVALKSVCTHLGCTPNWLDGERKFKCPCHGSGFYIDGINFEGPAPRPLERYAINVADDGQLEVDKSRKFQQELGQWSNPASYVAV